MTVSTVANCEPAGVPLASDLAALERAIKANLVCGAKWYLVESHWFEAYQEFLKSGDVDKNPGPIDNGPLMDENGDLKANLTELFDFVFVPSNVWEALVSTVGLKAGQNPMERCVIEHGLYNKTLVVSDI